MTKISEFTVADNLMECTSIELQLITENTQKRDPYSGELGKIAIHHLKITKQDFCNAFEEYLRFRVPTPYADGNPDNLPFECILEKSGKMIIGIDCRQKSKMLEEV